MKKYTELSIISFTLIYMILILIWSKDIGIYVLNSIKSCVNIIIPSLFVFMIISDFIVSSNIYILFGKPFSVVSRYIFRVPEYLFPVFLISSIGGYPVGAKIIRDIYTNNRADRTTLEHMLSYSYLSGPAFICGIVGINIFSDIKAGILIFVSILLTNIIIGIIIGTRHNIPSSDISVPELNITVNSFIKSIYSGGISLFNICIIIVFFSSCICIFEKTGIISFIAKIIDINTQYNYSTSIAIVKSFIEISNIHLFEPSVEIMPIIASLLSFGGLCIIIQIKSLTKVLSLKLFIIFRIISIPLSYFICRILCIYTYNYSLIVNSPAKITNGQNSPITDLFLLIMTILFLLKFSIEKIRKI